MNRGFNSRVHLVNFNETICNFMLVYLAEEISRREGDPFEEGGPFSGRCYGKESARSNYVKMSHLRLANGGVVSLIELADGLCRRNHLIVCIGTPGFVYQV